MAKDMVEVIAKVLVIIGGLNWGLFAIDPSYNLVKMLLGSVLIAEQAVYAIVALSAVYVAYKMVMEK